MKFEILGTIVTLSRSPEQSEGAAKSPRGADYSVAAFTLSEANVLPQNDNGARSGVHPDSFRLSSE